MLVKHLHIEALCGYDTDIGCTYVYIFVSAIFLKSGSVIGDDKIKNRFYKR